ncbi:MAG: hypothetical protein FWF77_08435 [Defluviitaleaceae bacterium]|nr:hypothetical protein [Defluviitaleaceae bacterium]
MSVAMKEQVFQTFDLLPEREQNLISELIQSLVPDDIATPEDVTNHAVAMDEYRRGECIDLDDIT